MHLRARYYVPGQGRFLNRDEWAGVDLRPLTLNGWRYVEGNPINRKDPSGRISQSEASAAGEIVDYLATAYNVQIDKDWGPAYWSRPGFIPGTWIPAMIRKCEWWKGSWRSLEELELTRDAVDVTAAALGGASQFRSAMQSVRIARWNLSRSTAFAPPFAASVVGDVVLTDYHFSNSADYALYNIVHELGHVWDWRSGMRLSSGMSAMLGTTICITRAGCVFDINAGGERPPGDPDDPYAGTSSWEDWAEAVATFVYPKYYLNNPHNLPLGDTRRQYVGDQINATP